MPTTSIIWILIHFSYYKILYTLCYQALSKRVLIKIKKFEQIIIRSQKPITYFTLNIQYMISPYIEKKKKTQAQNKGKQ